MAPARNFQQGGFPTRRIRPPDQKTARQRSENNRGDDRVGIAPGAGILAGGRASVNREIVSMRKKVTVSR